jgi:hypothetical protein
MKHLTTYKIFESSDYLYKEITQPIAVNLMGDGAINISKDTINKICKLLDNEFYYVDYTYWECNFIKDFDEKLIIRYCKFHFKNIYMQIEVTELDDYYYSVCVDYINSREYYQCDTIDGVMQLFKNTVKEKLQNEKY